MAWTTPADHAASVVSVSEWNSFHGAAGNCKFLKDAVDTNAAAIQSPMKAQQNGGAVVGGRNKLNFIAGANVTVTVADDSANDRINITLAASGGTVPTQGQSSAVGTVVSTSTPFSKGSYVELFASTSFESSHVIVSWSTGNSATLRVDIATGAAGAEVVKIPDLLGNGYQSSAVFSFPFKIPAGSRVSARSAIIVAMSQQALTISMTILG